MAEEHIYRKFDEDLEDIRANVIQMGAIIEEQIRNAIQSLEQIDPQLAQKVINRETRLAAPGTRGNHNDSLG